MPRRPSTSLKHRLQVAGRFRGAGHRCCRPLRFVGSFCRLVGSFASSRDTEKAPANPVRPAGFFPRPGVLKCLLRSALFRQTIAMAACRTCIGFLEASAAHSKATRSANVLSAQLYDAACKTHPQIPSEIEVGRFDTLHEWLKSHLYRYGRKYRPNELMERLVGGLSVRPYLAYLRFRRVDGAVQSDCLSGGLPLRSAWRRTPSHGDPKRL